MAKATVKTRRVNMSAEMLKRAAAQDPAVRDKIAKDFRLYEGRRMSRVVTDHFKDAISQAARITGMGVPGAHADRPVKVKTSYGDVDVGRWQALAQQYRNAKRRLRRGTENLYWKFTGGTSAYLYKTAAAIKPARILNVKVTPTSGGKSQVTVKVSSTITAPSTGDPVVDGLMRNSFVQGTSRAVGGEAFLADAGGRKKLTPAGIVAVNEARRPLLVELAAALGNRARQALSNLK